MRKNPSWRNRQIPGLLSCRGANTVRAWDRSNNASQLTQGTMYTMPIQLPAGSEYDQIGIRSTRAGISVARLGIYADDPFRGGPGALIKDFGTITEADLERTISITLKILKTDIYWLAFSVESSFQCRLGWSNGGSPMGLTDSATPDLNYTASGLKRTGVTAGSLPNPFGGTITTVQASPILLLRVLNPGHPTTVQTIDRKSVV